MNYSFNEYLEFLTESANLKDFTPEVKDALEELSYVTFGKDGGGVIATVKLDDMNRIGTYSCNIYPDSEKDIAVTISLKSKDGETTTLIERVINFEDSTWEKSFKKFIDDARKIVEKLSELNQAD